MSTYTLGEITAWLLLTAVLGFALGWLVREIQVRAAGRKTATSLPTSEPAEPESTPEPGPDPEPEPERIIKGKTKSMIYHTPQSGSYARTKADVWFATEDEAVAAGYRKPKNA